jgi:precorrin-6y C5,15-methyltransferase (decarboxylating) CbiE subunit
MITIIGAGPGTREYMTHAAVSAIASSCVIVGGARVLEEVKPPAGARVIELPPGMTDAAIRILDEESRIGDVSLLVSGDPGFYSLAGSVAAHFGRRNVKIIPGVSSLQIMASRIGKPWAGAACVTLHGGRCPHTEDMAEKLLSSPALVVLFGSPDEFPEQMERLASDETLGAAWAALGWDLGLPGEKVFEATSLKRLGGISYMGRLALLWLENGGRDDA